MTTRAARRKSERNAAAEAAAARRQVPVVELTLSLKTGRHIGLLLPADIQPLEVLELVGHLSFNLAPAIIGALQRTGAPVIETPRGPHVVQPARA